MADLTGARDLQKALDRKADGIVDAVGRAVDDSAEAILDDMRRHVPVATGALKRGIEDHKVDAFSHEVGVSNSKLYYATFVEHGTSSSPAQPFALPAAERERRQLPRRVADAINKELR